MIRRLRARLRSPFAPDRRSVASGLVIVAVASFGLGVTAPACRSGAPRAPAKVSTVDAVVRIKTAVVDASLWIDGAFIGAVGDLRGGVALDPGHHRLELRHEAYFVHYQDLDLAPGQHLTLDIELAPLLP